MRNTKNVFAVIVALVCALLVAHSAQAQDMPFGIDNVPNIVGIGGGMLPDYYGSDDYSGGAAPFFKYTPEKTEYYAMLIATQLYVNLANHPTLRFGPTLNYRFGRNDDVDDSVVKKMEEIDGTFEAGAFVGYEWKDSQNPLHRWGITVDILGDVGNEHKGYLVSLSARYWYPVSKMIDIGVAVGTTYADSNYMEKYFGVSEKDSERTGLPVFKAEDGIREVRVIPAVVMHFSPQWHAGIGVRYARLLDDAEDSPVVDDRGDANQWIYGLAVAYAW
jgi:outer membrane scaffolding protein for murein synthesis (MipA/OmpV family)